MHESDAMEFIESVLLGFLGRVFNFKESEEPGRYEPHLKKIKAFIKDETGYWVKEKALWIVHFFESMETQINSGQYEPVSPKSCVATVLDMSRERITGLVKTYKLTENPNRMQVFPPLPVLPREK